MENLTRLNLVDHKLAAPLPWNEKNTQNIEAMCKKLDGIVAQACWKEISYMYITISNEDPRGLYRRCNALSQKNHRDECYIYGAGNLVTFVGFNPKNLSAICQPYIGTDLALYDRCLLQITGAMIASSLEYRDRVITTCATADERFRGRCFRFVNDRLQYKNFSNSKLEEFCEKAPREYKKFCVNG